MPQQRPPSGRVAGACSARFSFAATPLGIQQRTQVLEPVGGHQARGDKLPQGVFDFAGETSGGARKVVEERRAVRLDSGEYFARGMRQRFAGLRLRAGQQPRCIIAQEDCERRHSGGANAAAALIGFGRRRFERGVR